MRIKATLALLAVLASAAVALAKPSSPHHYPPVRLALKAAPSM